MRLPEMTALPALLAAVLASATPFLSIPAGAEDAPGFSIGAKTASLTSEPQASERIGQMQLRGMLELPPIKIGGQRLVGLSDLAWDEDEQILYALSDRGSLFWLRPKIVNGQLVDVTVLAAYPLYELGNKRRLKSERADSEGLDIVNGANGRRGDTELIVSFERAPRIVAYRPNGDAIRDYPLPAPLDDIHNYAGANKALESVTLHPLYGVLTAPEYPLKKEPANRSRIFNLRGKSWAYPIAAGAGIVSIKALGGSDEILVVERDHPVLFGRTLIALRRFNLRTLALTTLAELNSDSGLRLDNFEGLAAHRGNRYFIVSDNNDMPFQRTLLLYFELLDTKR